MAWSDLESTQLVNYTDATTSGFTLVSGQSHVTSSECVTKAGALAKYVLDAAEMTSYQNDELVPKSVWVSGNTCPVPVLDGVTLISGGTVRLNYSVPANCNSLTLSYSSDQTNWTDSTAGCTAGRQVTVPGGTGTYYFRLRNQCTGAGTSNSNIVEYTFPVIPYVINVSRPITPGSPAPQSGTIVINTAPSTINLRAFGGASNGNTSSGSIRITGMGVYSTGLVTQYQTVDTPITFSSTGTFTVSEMTGLFVGNSGNYVTLS